MIKVTLKDEDQKKTCGYPCLKISSDKEIVLFDRPRSGYIVLSRGLAILYYSDNWAEENFKLYPDKVILQNEL